MQTTRHKSSTGETPARLVRANGQVSQTDGPEEAARLKGQSLSQWSLTNLDAAAARDIEEARAMRLSSE